MTNNNLSDPSIHLCINFETFLNTVRAESNWKKIILNLPLYQRDEAWSIDQIDTFQKEIEKSEHLFLGSIILIGPKEAQENGDLEFEVVDGQQRLIALLCKIDKNRKSEDEDKPVLDACIGNEKFSLIREFDRWRNRDQRPDKCKDLDSIKAGCFNWIIYPPETKGEALFQIVNTDSKQLSVFDEFITILLNNEKKSEPSFKWKDFKNQVAEDLLIEQTIVKEPSLPKFLETNRSLRNSFDNGNYEWYLRQFVAQCVYIAKKNKNENDSKRFTDSKNDAASRDKLQNQLRKEDFDASAASSVFKILKDGVVMNKDLLISRGSIKRLEEPLNVLQALQIYAMSYQTSIWLSLEDCFAVFSKYYDQKRADSSLEIDHDRFCLEFLAERMGSSSENPWQLSNILGIEDLKEIPDSPKIGKNITCNNRERLWIADWTLFFLINYKEGRKAEEIFLDSWKNAWVSLVTLGVSLNEVNEETAKEIFDKLKEIYSLEDKPVKIIPRFSGEIEHWVARNVTGTTTDLSPKLIETFGNLCLIPQGVNQSIRNETPQNKAGKLNQSDIQNFLPKLTFTILSTAKLSGITLDNLMIFLNIFWSEFMTQARCFIFKEIERQKS